MKRITQLFIALLIVVGLGAGCGKKQGAQPATAEPGTPADENWQPESADLPAGHTADDGHDHTDHEGHDHGAHGGHAHDAEHKH